MRRPRPENADTFLRNAVEASVRIGLIAIVMLCYEIVRPLMLPALWGIILAISFRPAFLLLAR